MSESARSVLKHLYKEGRMAEEQYKKIDRNLKERPHGSWRNCRLEMHTLNFGECSKCREKGVLGDFCMWCGAYMRKEGDSE